jgi:hypothetical protein
MFTNSRFLNGTHLLHSVGKLLLSVLRSNQMRARLSFEKWHSIRVSCAEMDSVRPIPTISAPHLQTSRSPRSATIFPKSSIGESTPGRSCHSSMRTTVSPVRCDFALARRSPRDSSPCLLEGNSRTRFTISRDLCARSEHRDPPAVRAGERE